MTDAWASILIACFMLVPLSFLVPRDHAANFTAGFTGLVLTVMSPMSMLWLMLVIVLTNAAGVIGDKTGRKDLCAGLAVATVTAMLLIGRVQPGVFWVGGAYFTLRNLHVVLDWWSGRQKMPGFADLLRYNLFLPVMIAGPIHRYQGFARAWQRRRFSPDDLATGAERVLFGLGMAVVLGNWMLPKLIMPPLQALLADEAAFLQQWALSAFGWIKLYLIFAGLSSVAVGLSRMMGLPIEENFNHPYRARNLVDFWTRWHITLSLWCRDYMFQPVATLTRSPVIGIIAAMIVLGLWHETSVYYVLWAIWQAGGIIGSRVLARFYPPMPEVLRALITPVLILGWLSLAKPVIFLVIGGVS